MSKFDPISYAELKALAAQLAAASSAINTNVDAAETAMLNSNSAQTTEVNNNTNAARDNTNGVTNAARDNVKAHVSAVVAGIPASGVKNVQHVVGTNANWTSGNDGVGANYYLDVPISAVNTAKAFIIPIRPTYTAATGYALPLAYRFLNGSTVRCLSFGNATQPGAYAFQVVEN